MANTPGGSFIPKRSTGKVVPTRSGKRVYIFSYIAYVFFFGSLLSVLGVFFLNQQVANQLKSNIALVDAAQEDLNRGQLGLIRALDSRLKAADQILNLHAAPSVIFEALESVIVKDVQLNTFEYTRESSSRVLLALGGLTETFDVLLFQRDIIANSSLLSAASVVGVSFGASDTEIEGADRENGSTQNDSGKATVTFVFEDNSILNSIGYKPRQMNDTIVSSVPDNVEDTVNLGGSEVNSDVDNISG
ncbi:hypothetical protein N8083_01670 [Candidatus Pacebacteria bacterium]|nr:hypothetical protein [Candidatus Paceibacterota bacterium]